MSDERPKDGLTKILDDVMATLLLGTSLGCLSGMVVRIVAVFVKLANGKFASINWPRYLLHSVTSFVVPLAGLGLAIAIVVAVVRMIPRDKP